MLSRGGRKSGPLREKSKVIPVLTLPESRNAYDVNPNPQTSPDSKQVARFAALFAGNTRTYGTYNQIDKERGDGKLLGKPSTVFKTVTEELYAQHLAGTNGLGIVPIRDDNSCVFGAIDIDVYADLNHSDIARGLKEMALPLV